MPSSFAWRQYFGGISPSLGKLDQYIPELAKSYIGRIILHNLFSRECRMMPNRSMRHSPNVQPQKLLEFLVALDAEVGKVPSLNGLTQEGLCKLIGQAAKGTPTRYFVQGIRRPSSADHCQTILPLRSLAWRYPQFGYENTIPALGTNKWVRRLQRAIDEDRIGVRLEGQPVRAECVEPTWIAKRREVQLAVKDAVSGSRPDETAAMRDILGLTQADTHWVRIDYPSDFLSNPPTGVNVANPTFIDGGRSPLFRPRVFPSPAHVRDWGLTVHVKTVACVHGVEEAVHNVIRVHPPGYELSNLPACTELPVEPDYCRLYMDSKAEVS